MWLYTFRRFIYQERECGKSQMCLENQILKNSEKLSTWSIIRTHKKETGILKIIFWLQCESEWLVFSFLLYMCYAICVTLDNLLNLSDLKFLQLCNWGRNSTCIIVERVSRLLGEESSTLCLAHNKCSIMLAIIINYYWSIVTNDIDIWLSNHKWSR